jgi:hypothetical protein
MSQEEPSDGAIRFVRYAELRRVKGIPFSRVHIRGASHGVFVLDRTRSLGVKTNWMTGAPRARMPGPDLIDGTGPDGCATMVDVNRN